MAADSSNLSTVSSSLIINSIFPCSGVFVRTVGIPISVGMMGFHSICDCEQRYTSGFAGSGSVSLEYPGEFIHPFSLGGIQSFFSGPLLGFCWRPLPGHCFAGSAGVEYRFFYLQFLKKV